MHSSIESRIEEMRTNPLYNTVFLDLSLEEKAVINAYTDNQYKNVNAYLRGTKFDAGHEAALHEISIQLSTALQKIDPPFISGNPVFRGCYMSADEISECISARDNNGTVIHACFSSTSKNAAMAFYDKDKNAMKIIKSKKGKFIMDLSVYPLEEEVLFDKRSEFKVTHINDTPDRLYVHLEEV